MKDVLLGIQYPSKLLPIGLAIGSAFGLFLGIQGSLVILQILDQFSSSVTLVVGVGLAAFAYGGGVVGLWMISQRREYGVEELQPRERQVIGSKLLDTSTLIDGRIAELCATGFAEGPFLIPRCVLGELQAIADSSIPDKRARGKRGLDVLERLQRIDGVTITIPDERSPKGQTVDWQLIHLAKVHQAKLVTNDWNLRKVARPQGIQVISVSELCYLIKPAILPGDLIRVHLFKEGQLQNQAVAHLDDGTMVVVNQARFYLGKNVDIVVTNLHQTQTGLIVFGALCRTDEHVIHCQPMSEHNQSIAYASS
ncbi:MAG: PIN domain nuclease [Nitrospirales bacterium]|nr:PIN domain nuclease [Nitrospirales bacterium]